jgi:hypothetical protein
MLQQLAPAGGSASFLNGVQKPRLKMQHSVNRLLHHLFGVFAGAGGELAETSFFAGRQMYFHAASLGFAGVSVKQMDRRQGISAVGCSSQSALRIRKEKPATTTTCRFDSWVMLE